MSVGAVTLVVIGGVGGFCYGRVGFASFGSTKSELASMYYVLGGIAVLVVFAAVLRFCVAMRSAKKHDKLEHAGAPQAPDAEEGAQPSYSVEDAPQAPEQGEQPSDFVVEGSESCFVFCSRQAEPAAVRISTESPPPPAKVTMSEEDKHDEGESSKPQHEATAFKPDPIWNDKVRLNKNLFWTIFLYFVFFTYPSVCLRILRTYDCDTNFSSSKGERGYLRADYSQECTFAHGEYPPMYQAQRYWAWAFVCFFVLGVPLAYLVVLFRYKRHLKPDAKRIMFDVLIDKLREDIARTDDLNLKLTYENNQKKLLADRNKLIMDMSPFEHVLFAKQDPGPPTNDSREIKKGKRDFDAPIPYRDEAARNRIRLIVDIMFHMYGFRLQVTTAEETSALEARKILEAQSKEEKVSIDDVMAEEALEAVKEAQGVDNEGDSGIDSRLNTSTAELEKQLVMEYRKQDPYIQHLTILWSSYEPEAWHFEFFECIRRLLLTGFLGIIPDPTMQILWASAFSVAFLFLYGACAPFALKSADRLQTISQAMTFMQLYVGLLIVEELIPINTSLLCRGVVIALVWTMHAAVGVFPVLLEMLRLVKGKCEEKTGHQLSEMLPDDATKVSERDVVQAFNAIGVHDMFRAQGPRRG